MNHAGSDAKVKAWAPSVPCKIPDNIVSSEFTSMKVFVPSYERERRPCIEQLLTNEYQRIWWQEKEVWDKRHSTKIPTKKLLQRMLIRRKPTTTPVMDMTKKVKKIRKKKVSKSVDTEEKQIEEPIEPETTEEKEDDKDKETA
ncbi:uncharacterized protein LOC143376380 [Andrena cerasifolii]|uniref:uncharacterized protein LOC143376380 n=1 Tax=Andrena cerasifolii TaxID=2819439 RepID=UPI004037FF57